MDFRSKASNHLFLLLALLPIPRFLYPNKKIRGVLESRLFHQCVDIVIEPLKKAAQFGVMMSDPLGFQRFCFPPLAAYIVDTPESALISGVAGKTSSVTMASYKEFGDNFRHPSRTAASTLGQLALAEADIHPWNLERYIPEAMKYRLNGVHCPFWRDYPLSDPSIFLTPEPLHHWHKQFWDHDVKWCINAVGAAEINFRFSILHPHTGFRQFKEGISSLKQVTGREHRDVQRYIVPLIAGAVSQDFLKAIRFLLDFRYLAQAPSIDEDTCSKIEAALNGFHDHKHAILDAKARRGKGKSTIDNWFIPKLEFLQSVVHSIRLNGATIQWSADATEHAHIEVVKDPARSGNNQEYESQICRSLDRSDKLRNFDLATAVLEANIDFRAFFNSESLGDDDDDTFDANSNSNDNHFQTIVSSSEVLLSEIDTVSGVGAASRHIVDYFHLSAELLAGQHLMAPRPYRTFQSSHNVACHLIRDPTYKRTLVDEVSAMFSLPDLRGAIGDYLGRISGKSGKPHISTIGGRRLSGMQCMLPFTHIQVWNRVRVQARAYHYPHHPLPAHTINAYPPSPDRPLGHYDSVIINLDTTKEWPSSGLSGQSFLSSVVLFLLSIINRSCGL